MSVKQGSVLDLILRVFWRKDEVGDETSTITVSDGEELYKSFYETIPGLEKKMETASTTTTSSKGGKGNSGRDIVEKFEADNAKAIKDASQKEAVKEDKELEI